MWDVAYRRFRHWSRQGVWDDIHDALRDQCRRVEGRDTSPSAAVLDAQSARSASGGEQIGFDAGKKVRGRKRHLLIDTMGLLLIVVVHSASVQDRAGAKLVLEEYPGIGLVRGVQACKCTDDQLLRFCTVVIDVYGAVASEQAPVEPGYRI